MALLPFKTLSMKNLQCSFLAGMKNCSNGMKIRRSSLKFSAFQFSEVGTRELFLVWSLQMEENSAIARMLQPKLVLFPDQLKSQLTLSKNYTNWYYLRLTVPSLREDFKVRLMRYLDFKLQPRILAQGNLAIARLEGQRLLRNGNYLLVPAKKPAYFSNKQQLHWGSVDADLILKSFKR